MSYRAPVADILFSMNHAGGLARGIRDGIFPDLDEGSARAILTQAGQIAEDVLLPLDRVGDQHGIGLVDGHVRTAPGWADAYRQWRGGGWNGVSAPAQHGGMALPTLINLGCLEMWSSANASFALGPLLTMGAVEALHRHGEADLRRTYLPKLVSGEWTGTMNLTEPQAGSDVGALRTQARPDGDGTYRITGQKIYITYGDHDLTDNIVHLVLARLPDAPGGTRGISLFLVPKNIPSLDGGAATPNDVFCSGIETKLGMHAAPTCTMVYGDRGGATGWLIGEPNQGLACMFTMMNNARLAIGIQGVAAAERATQKAVAFAKARRQGRTARSGSEPSPIIEHPDVARMLLTMKAQTAAARAICHMAAAAIDLAEHSPDEPARRRSAARAALLTPLAKAFATDIGNEVASLGVQVHGGMGYVEETGAAQIMRDVRIAAIYEGTNGIQAIDLATRKLAADGGAAARAEIADMRAIVDAVRGSNAPGFGATAARLHEAVDALADATRFFDEQRGPAPEHVLGGATDYLRLFGLARGGTALAALALAAGDRTDAPAGTAAVCRFFAERLCPAAGGLAQTIVAGGGALADAASAFTDA